jgi:hypothetical protein
MGKNSANKEWQVIGRVRPVLFTYRAEFRVGGENQTGRFYDEESAEFSNAFSRNVVQRRNSATLVYRSLSLISLSFNSK